ncbi:MFS transporter [Zhihengliuella alba]|uniref:MFS transporter n=1 Tax=Zhihengliuella alba TaxID=547018 RepID=A0ABP7DKW5_9MICC
MTTTAPLDVTPERLRTAKKAVISSSIGAALEWFDFTVYAAFAVVIAANFFPSEGEGAHVIGLMQTFAAFALSYLIRPIGAMILGSYADRKGRRNALTLTMLLMMVATLIMALAPTYDQVGVWAAAAILLSRLVQGFSAGGEFGTATTFLIESAPHRKAFYASWQIAAQGASLLLSSAFGYALYTWMSEEDLYAWGWRIPFFFGLLVGPVGLYIRARMSETEEFVNTVREKTPLRAVLTRHPGRTLAGIGVIGVATISVYMIFYMPTFAIEHLDVPATAGYLGGLVAGIVMLVGSPFVGALADRVGAGRVMTVAAVAALVLAWPLFAFLVAFPGVGTLVAVIVVLGIVMTFYFAPLPALLSALFPAAIRGSGLSVSYNVGVTLFGGIAPLVLTWLLDATGVLETPGYYYLVIAVVSLVGLHFVRTRYRD